MLFGAHNVPYSSESEWTPTVNDMWTERKQWVSLYLWLSMDGKGKKAHSALENCTYQCKIVTNDWARAEWTKCVLGSVWNSSSSSSSCCCYYHCIGIVVICAPLNHPMGKTNDTPKNEKKKAHNKPQTLKRLPVCCQQSGWKKKRWANIHTLNQAGTHTRLSFRHDDKHLP